MDKLEYWQLKYRLDNEGEGYALKHYYGRDIDHEDAHVVKLWAEAHDKLVELESYIKDKVRDELES